MGELARKLKRRGATSPRRRSGPNGSRRCWPRSNAARSADRSQRTSSRRCGRAAARPTEIIDGEGLTQVDDESEIAALIAGVLAANADAVAQYRGGKAATFGFLVGQVMKAAKGKANPKRVNELLRQALGALTCYTETPFTRTS